MRILHDPTKCVPDTYGRPTEEDDEKAVTHLPLMLLDGWFPTEDAIASGHDQVSTIQSTRHPSCLCGATLWMDCTLTDRRVPPPSKARYKVQVWVSTLKAFISHFSSHHRVCLSYLEPQSGNTKTITTIIIICWCHASAQQRLSNHFVWQDDFPNNKRNAWVDLVLVATAHCHCRYPPQQLSTSGDEECYYSFTIRTAATVISLMCPGPGMWRRRT